MSVTVKVNGTDNSLVHKGSTGMAKCTAPDVCKTPSPGGPVPVPYPVIISMSSDLENGTTTVKADGGNMIAIKGSDFSRCSGDEAGTAGGVKSNVNMKEATWILYSFDVKMDGANACRKTDKMMMNHENTVCMSGEDQAPEKLEPLDLNIDCKEKKDPKKTDPPWDDCMVAQLCQMVKEFNAIDKKKLVKQDPSPRGTKPYKDQLSSFMDNFESLVNTKPPNEEAIKSQFYNPGPPNEDCAYKKWNKGGRNPRPSGRGTGKFNPDHTHPAGLGGSLQGISGLKWAEARVNMTAGPAMNTFDPDKHSTMTASKCCT